MKYNSEAVQCGREKSGSDFEIAKIFGKFAGKTINRFFRDFELFIVLQRCWKLVSDVKRLAKPFFGIILHLKRVCRTWWQIHVRIIKKLILGYYTL